MVKIIFINFVSILFKMETIQALKNAHTLDLSGTNVISDLENSRLILKY